MDSDIKRNFSDTAARTVSVVFHPLLMPVYSLAVIFWAPTILEYLPAAVKRILLLIVLVNNILIPLILMFLFRTRNIISSYNVEERNERSVPLFTAAIFYAITSYIIFRFQIPLFLKSFFLGVTLLIVVITIINFWWKISVHSAAAGAFTASVIGLMEKMYTPLAWYLIAAVFISGLVLASRLRLKLHNPPQAWAGFFAGLIGLGIFLIFL